MTEKLDTTAATNVVSVFAEDGNCVELARRLIKRAFLGPKLTTKYYEAELEFVFHDVDTGEVAENKILKEDPPPASSTRSSSTTTSSGSSCTTKIPDTSAASSSSSSSLISTTIPEPDSDASSAAAVVLFYRTIPGLQRLFLSLSTEKQKEDDIHLLEQMDSCSSSRLQLAVCCVFDNEGIIDEPIPVGLLEEREDTRLEHFDVCLDHGFQRCRLLESEAGEEGVDDCGALNTSRGVGLDCGGVLLNTSSTSSSLLDEDEQERRFSGIAEIRDSFECHMWPHMEMIDRNNRSCNGEREELPPSTRSRYTPPSTSTSEESLQDSHSDLEREAERNKGADVKLSGSQVSRSPSPTFGVHKGCEETATVAVRRTLLEDKVVDAHAPNKASTISSKQHPEDSDEKRQQKTLLEEGTPSTDAEGGRGNSEVDEDEMQLENLDKLMHQMRQAHDSAKGLSDEDRRKKAEDLALRMMSLLNLSDDEDGEQ
ncbi:unnamed protein product [Amoebophrya sp. A25]|nr:unnamed protein product [Amoebophrya sp. A25]|eukprot:GSA25T00027410001.1